MTTKDNKNVETVSTMLNDFGFSAKGFCESMTRESIGLYSSPSPVSVSSGFRPVLMLSTDMTAEMKQAIRLQLRLHSPMVLTTPASPLRTSKSRLFKHCSSASEWCTP